MKRREFIIQSGLLGTAALTHRFQGSTRFESSEIDRLVSKTFGIDTHNHVDVPFLKEEFMGQRYDLAEALTKSGLGTICLTFSVDRPLLKNPGEAYNRFMTSMQEIDDVLVKNQMTRALNVTDIQRARKSKQRVVIQSVEGGHFLEGKIDPGKATRAAKLSFEKYCSVSKTLEPTATILYKIVLNGEKLQ